MERAVKDEPSKFEQLKTRVLAGARKRGKWLPTAREAYKFTATNQWTEEDKNKLEEDNRAAVSFNRVAPIINAVCGMEENSRQEVVYLPREEGDANPNEVLSGVAKWIRGDSMAAQKESRAFRDLVITGEGWIETRMDYDDDPMGKVVYSRVSPLEVGVDEDAHEDNYADARLHYRVRMMDPAAAKELVEKDVSAEAIHAGWFGALDSPEDGGKWDKKDYPSETRDGMRGDAAKRMKVRVVQVWWWEQETYMMVSQSGIDEYGNELDPEIAEMSEAEFRKYEERANIAGIDFQSAKAKRKTYYTAILGAEGILTETRLDTECFPMTPMTGYYDEDGEMFYGLLRDLMDPQRWANKALSLILEIISTNAKGGLLAEQDAFVNQRKAEQDWADPTKIVWMKAGGLAKVKERQPSPVPAALNDVLMFAISSIRDVSGVNLELLGQANREQAASLEMQRRESAMNILAVLFASLRTYRLISGKKLLSYIKLLPDNTLARVHDNGKLRYTPIVKDDDFTRYDVIIDETPYSPTQKAATWAIIRELMTGGVPLPPQAILAALKYSPLPESVVQEMMQASGLGGNEESPEQIKMKLEQAEQALQVLQQQLQEVMGKAEELEKSKMIEIMKAAVDEYEAETDRIKIGLEYEISAAQVSRAAEQTITPSERTNDAQETQ